MNADVCQCEHEVHTVCTIGDGTHEPEPRPAVEHVYGNAEPVREVKTAFGTFALCRLCVEAGHMTGATPRVHR